MKKTLTAIILILALALCLAACSAGEVASAGEEEFVPEMPDVPVTKGKAEVDVGSFRVTVPEGWLGVGDLDYEDDGSTYNYERGQFSEITFQWNDRTRTLSIAKKLYEEGVYVNSVLPPACAEGECLLRTSYMATLTKPLVEEATDILARVLKEDA